MRTKVKLYLIRVAALGPVAWLLADRLGHVLGICIGG